MSEELHRYVYGSAFEGKKISLVPGRVNNFTVLPDGVGIISFVLRSEMGLQAWPNQAFVLEGEELRIEDKTDSDGLFKHSPAEFGDYQLTIDEVTFTISAIPPDGLPIEVHVPYAAIDSHRSNIQGPTDEELAPEEDEPASEDEDSST